MLHLQDLLKVIKNVIYRMLDSIGPLSQLWETARTAEAEGTGLDPALVVEFVRRATNGLLEKPARTIIMGKLKNAEKAEDKTDLNANIRAVPDGGFGWVISAAAFVVQFIILGIQNNLGLFHVEHLEDFKKSKLETGIASFYFASIPRGVLYFYLYGYIYFQCLSCFLRFYLSR